MSQTLEYAVGCFLLGFVLTWAIRGIFRLIRHHWKAVLATCLFVWVWYQVCFSSITCLPEASYQGEAQEINQS
jgi:hypothetical protein